MYVDIRRCEYQARLGSKDFLSTLKILLEARSVSDVLNKLHARYRSVEYDLNAFGARFRYASVRYMCVHEIMLQ